MAVSVVVLVSSGLAAALLTTGSGVASPRDAPLAASAATPSAFSPVWTNLSLSGPDQPPPRNTGSMVYDATSGSVILFGGQYFNGSTDATQYYNDTWSFHAGVWTNVTPAVSPPERSGAELAYDPPQNEVILFGGTGPDHQEYNDTWIWSGSPGTWTNITSTVGPAPPPGFWFSMAYDAQTEAILLFGGVNFTDGIEHTYTNQTWSFLGDAWTHLSPATVPVGRQTQEMVWDTVDDEMLMFGGQGLSGPLNDTWTYYDGNWNELSPAVHPGARGGYGLAFDSSINRVVLYGGSSSGSDFYSTWLYVGGTWTQYNTTVEPTNPQATYEQFVYDAADNEVVDLNEPIAEGGVSTWVLTISSVGASNYPVTFQESGLPAGTSWSVDFGGATNGSTTADVGFSVPDGTYSYTVTPVAGYTATPSSGSLTVSGAPLTQDIAFAPGTTFSVTLAADPDSVTLGNATNLTAVTSGGTAPFDYTYSGLPPGCASVDEAKLPCLPTAAGTYPLTVSVTDDLGHFAEANASLTVSSPTKSTPPPSSSSGTSDWWWIAIVGVVAVLVVLALVLRRRRPAPGPAPGLPPTTPPPAPPTPPGSSPP